MISVTMTRRVVTRQTPSGDHARLFLRYLPSSCGTHRATAFPAREHETTEDSFPLSGDHIPIKLRDVTAAGLTEAKTQGMILKQVTQACDHLTIIAHQKSGGAVNDRFRLVIFSRYNGQPAGGRLQQNSRRTLPARRKHKNIGT